MFRTSSELGLFVVIAVCCGPSGCNAIAGLGDYSFPEPDVTHCGPDQNEDCSISLPVKGGPFTRSFDRTDFKDPCLSGLRPPPCLPQRFTATVSDFELDKFEVTVGRFRLFTDAVARGYKPEPGSGRHDVNDHKGLAFTGGHESGWDANWSLPASWNDLADPRICAHHTWTIGSDVNERLPINCLTWQEAYAFCIWDGGYLPSEAEWDYAASGGDEGRPHPWSTPKEDPPPDLEHAVFDCLLNSTGPSTTVPGRGTCVLAGADNIARAGSRPKGYGKFHHADLAGNLAEWTMDFFDKPYREDPCKDCMTGGDSDTSTRVVRGGSYTDPASFLANGHRDPIPPNVRRDWIGVRCARNKKS